MGLAYPTVAVGSAVATSMGVVDEEQGLAAGLRQTSFQVGVALGVAVLLSVAASHSAALHESRTAALVDGFQLALIVLAGLVGVAAIVALVGLALPTIPPDINRPTAPHEGGR